MAKKFIEEAEEAVNRYSHSGTYKTIEKIEDKTMGWSVPLFTRLVRGVKMLVDRLLARD